MGRTSNGSVFLMSQDTMYHIAEVERFSKVIKGVKLGDIEDIEEESDSDSEFSSSKEEEEEEEVN